MTHSDLCRLKGRNPKRPVDRQPHRMHGLCLLWSLHSRVPGSLKMVRCAFGANYQQLWKHRPVGHSMAIFPVCSHHRHYCDARESVRCEDGRRVRRRRQRREQRPCDLVYLRMTSSCSPPECAIETRAVSCAHGRNHASYT